MAHATVNLDKMPAGAESNALMAERVMGWKELKRQSDRYWGRKERPGGAVAASGGPGLLARARDGISRRA